MNLSPAVGWATIAVLVGVWDLSNKRTLSSYAQAHPLATAVIGGITLAHLTGALPSGIDPFDGIAHLVRKV